MNGKGKAESEGLEKVAANKKGQSCIHFFRGNCTRGDDCQYGHILGTDGKPPKIAPELLARFDNMLQPKRKPRRRAGPCTKYKTLGNPKMHPKYTSEPRIQTKKKRKYKITQFIGSSLCLYFELCSKKRLLECFPSKGFILLRGLRNAKFGDCSVNFHFTDWLPCPTGLRGWQHTVYIQELPVTLLSTFSRVLLY